MWTTDVSARIPASRVRRPPAAVRVIPRCPTRWQQMPYPDPVELVHGTGSSTQPSCQSGPGQETLEGPVGWGAQNQVDRSRPESLPVSPASGPEVHGRRRNGNFPDWGFKSYAIAPLGPSRDAAISPRSAAFRFRSSASALSVPSRSWRNSCVSRCSSRDAGWPKVGLAPRDRSGRIAEKVQSPSCV